MKQTINLFQFRNAFKDMGRTNQFSYDALGLLFNYFEQYEDDTGEEMELDVIAICCEYSEETPEQIAQSYGIEISDMYPNDRLQYVNNYLAEHTSVVGITNNATIIYQQF